MQQVQEISKQVSGPRSFVFLYSSKEDRLFISSGVETNLNVGKIIREINEKFGTSGGGSQFLGQIALKGKRFDEILKHVKQTLGVSE
jgi:alanyl-tRNA synthetase